MKVSREGQRVARQLFRAVVAGDNFEEDAKKVVAKLSAEKPRGYLGILEAFLRMLRLEVESKHAVVESAASLSPELASQVTADLMRKYGTQLTTEFVVNPDILGGIKVRVGSDVWDGSVASRLDRLRDSFN